MESLNTFQSVPYLFGGAFLLFCAFKIYYSFIWVEGKRKNLINAFPGPPPIPVLGNALLGYRPNEELFALAVEMFDTYGRIFRLWLGNRPYIVISDVKLTERILSSNILIEKSDDYQILEKWLGTGLLTANRHKWSKRRKLITPAFHFKILDEFIGVFSEQSSTLVEILRGKSEEGNYFNIFPYVTRCALDVICETAMGKKVYAQKKGDSEYVRAVYGMCDLMVKRMIRAWLRPDIVWNLSHYRRLEKKYLKVLHTFTENVIAERKEEKLKHKALNLDRNDNEIAVNFDNNNNSFEGKRRLAFMDLLLDVSQNGKVLSDLDIREETDTFMFEGHDTTSASLIWTLYLFASNPHVQVKAQEELDEIFESKTNDDLTMGDLGQMKYLECCIKESLRLFPSVPYFSRKVKDDFELEDGRTIPGGTVAIIINMHLHRDPATFENPDDFIPERFLPENNKGRNPFAYVPFSAGPRNCIGQKFAMLEEKSIISRILYNFTLETKLTFEDIVILPDLILRPKDGIEMKITPRHSTSTN